MTGGIDRLGCLFGVSHSRLSKVELSLVFQISLSTSQ